MKLSSDQMLHNDLVQLLLDKFAGFVVIMMILYRRKVTKIDTHQLFKTVWNDVTERQWVVALLKHIHHPHQLLTQERLMLRMLYKFRQMNLPVSLNIKVKFENNCPETIKSGLTQGIFFTIHNGMHFSLKEILNFGLPAATIAADYDEVVNKGPIFLNKIVDNYQIIKRDNRSLVKFKAAAKSGNNLYIAVDYEEVNENKFKYVSPAPFSFAHKIKMQMYFIKEAIHINGDVEITIAKYSPSENVLGKATKDNLAIEIADDFIKYVQTTYPYFKRELTVKEYLK